MSEPIPEKTIEEARKLIEDATGQSIDFWHDSFDVLQERIAAALHQRDQQLAEAQQRLGTQRALCDAALSKADEALMDKIAERRDCDAATAERDSLRIQVEELKDANATLALECARQLTDINMLIQERDKLGSAGERGSICPGSQNDPESPVESIQSLRTQLAEARKKERERCATVAERWPNRRLKGLTSEHFVENRGKDEARKAIAATIRALPEED